MPTGRFQPYGMSRTRPNEYRNAEAGPSTLTAPLIPYFDLPTSQPPGGISETTANAEPEHTITEEEEAPVSNFYCSRIPHVTEWSFGVRSPNGPGSPAAKESHATTVCGRRESLASCATG